MTTPTSGPAGSGRGIDPADAVRAVLDDLGPADHAEVPARDADTGAGDAPAAGPGGPDRADAAPPTPTPDRLERVDEAHRRLRRLLELPDA